MNSVLIQTTQNPLIISRGLVGYWTLNDGTGTIVRDFSGNDNNGVLGGATIPIWTTGKNGGGLNFSGDDWVTILSSPSLNITGNEISFGCWVYPTGTADYQMLIGKDVNASARQYAIYLAQANTSQVYVALSGTTPTAAGLTYNISSPWVINTWNHLFFTYKSGTGAIIYLNGSSVYSSEWTGTITSQTANIHIGSEGSDNLYHTVGKIDDVRIYNVTLTQSEITTLYNARGA